MSDAAERTIRIIHAPFDAAFAVEVAPRWLTKISTPPSRITAAQAGGPMASAGHADGGSSIEPASPIFTAHWHRNLQCSI